MCSSDLVLEDDRARGKKHPILVWMQRLLQVRRVTLFRDEKMMEGLLLAMGLHSLFDFLVSLPDVLPGNPTTLGALLHYGGPLSGIPIVMIPGLLYTFGGWFLLSHLFAKKGDLHEYGYKLKQEVFVRSPTTSATPV